METTWDIGILNFTKELNLSFCNGTYIENCKEFELDEIGYDRDLIEKIVRVIVPVFFGMIGILGLIGNTLVVIVVAANPGMRSTTNILIINLAVADLLFVIFCIPFTATDFVLPFWPFGNIWCKIVQYLIIVTAYASVYTLVLMSLDRYLAVVHPITSMSWRTENHAILAICIAWAFIFALSTPALVIHGEIHFTFQDLDDSSTACRILPQYDWSFFQTMAWCSCECRESTRKKKSDSFGSRRCRRFRYMLVSDPGDISYEVFRGVSFKIGDDYGPDSESHSGIYQ
ncbi:allatostatin-A receptor-like isoform X5 [Vespa crabro]|uniref:allatostatin-A receptor-like isoform X5 n=1 Tax=Vespa crabro TaxID=7445 RepID=UPI001F0004A0|nr:allatostatin-A receptor-like isoform X5 [Vespa crabro]